MAREFNDPLGGTPSTIGTQVVNDFFKKKALIEIRKEQYFSQLAEVTSMPKNMGKKIKLYHYLPLLDDRNINDQGIDAAGVAIATTQYWLDIPRLIGSPKDQEATGGVTAKRAYVAGDYVYCANGVANTSRWKLQVGAVAVGGDATAGTSKTNAQMATILNTDVVGTTFTVAEDVITSTSLNFYYTTEAAALAASKIVGGSIKSQRSGNLYGSSKDIGSISGKLPALSENGGRVNRVGFKRVELEGTFEKFGFFDEYTQESLDFDSDAELEMHINRELLNGANEITEDALQIDLINSAGTIRYAGDATQNSEMGTSGTDDIVTYGDLMRLSIDLDNNRTPKNTTIFTGTRLVDTKTLSSSRVIYIGSELLPTIKAMTDLHSNPAFISVEKYAAGGTLLNGEVGAIDQFRIVVVPEMMKWAGAGADAAGDTTHHVTGGRYDVFPMLCIGDGSFTTIGFQTDGKSVKFVTTHKKPGIETADRTDPYGETGFMSIKWYYGFMILRSERIGLIKTIATL